MTTPPVLTGWEHAYSGKVRDIYTPASPHPLGDVLLVVASDRISAFDWVLPTAIPGKGKVLTALSLWWFAQLRAIVPGHVLDAEVPAEVLGRAMVCRRLRMYPVECVARGFLTGSGLAEYRRTGAVCGIELPPGLVEASRLAAPIFTPAAKAPQGEHDENITFGRLEEIVGGATAAKLARLTLEVYSQALAIAAERGIIIADTKLEFGLAGNQITLGDEVLTPDSSRFWLADSYREGVTQPSFDKQPVRDYLRDDSGWDPAAGTPPPPLPDDVVAETQERYLTAYRMLTGYDLAL